MLHGKNSPTEIESLSSSPWSPLRRPVFRWLWIATVVSNIGTWMQSTATAWLMTSLAPSALMVSLVQTATSLPIFLLALPAGALADVLDRRRLILFTQTWMLCAAAALGFLTLAGRTTPWALLLLTLLLGLGAALNAPAWQAIVPELVPRTDIPAAVAINSAGFNVARSVGPALGGIVVGLLGAASAFLINSASFLGVVLVVFRWHRAPRESSLPAEHMLAAIRTGLRYVFHAPILRAVLVRAASFTICASALMALLPLLARKQLGVTAVGYGLLLGSFGLGAVAGALLLPRVRQAISLDWLVVIATVIFAAVLATAAVFHRFAILGAALALAGAAWLALLSSFNSSAQTVAAGWVRGRALAVYMLILFGSMAGGSFIWGIVADHLGVPETLVVAAAGLLVALAVTRDFKLSPIQYLDLTPSMHWPSHAVMSEPQSDEGPLLVMIEYLIDPIKSGEFTSSMRQMRNARLRDGAISWDLFVDAAQAGRYVESFMVESWTEHLRQHERVTVADRELEKVVHSFHKGKQPPVVTHLLSKPLPK